MPTDEKILGFSNRWYPDAIKTANHFKLDRFEIQLITAPLFIATKLEAFETRGNQDFLSSHDLEDLISVIDGRDSIMNEIKASSNQLKTFLSNTFTTLLSNNNFTDALQGHLPPDPASQARYPLLLEKLQSITQL